MFDCYSKTGLLLGRTYDLEGAAQWEQFHFANYQRRGEPGCELEQLCYALSLRGFSVSLRHGPDRRWQLSLIVSGSDPISAARTAADAMLAEREGATHA